MQTIEIINNFLFEKSSTRTRRVVFFIASFIATGCGIGKIKYAPGTFGSLFAIIFCPYFVLLSQVLQILILSTLLIFGFLSINIFLIKTNRQNEDPKEVVIDEVIAVFLTSWLCQISIPAVSMHWFHFLAIFILFRFFDILKPYPISWVDKNIHGAKGIILDDLMAAFASFLVFLVYF